MIGPPKLKKGGAGGVNIGAAAFQFEGMTTANKITIIRILLVPFFMVQLLYYVSRGEEVYRALAIGSFLLAAISDGVDGFVARRFNQRSELGAILDPLADKLLLVLGLVALSLDNYPYLPRIPLWLVATVLSRDVLILIGFVVIYYSCGKIEVRAHPVGKVATVLQMATILWALFKWNAGGLAALTLAAALGTGISALLYVRDGVRQLSASPTSGPTPPSGGSSGSK